MSINRRELISKTSMFSAAALVPGMLKRTYGAESNYADITGAARTSDPLTSDHINKCVVRAVEAAIAAGAEFADARVTRVVTQAIQASTVSDVEEITFGVRTFQGGIWGFSASPFVDLNEAEALAKTSVLQAQINSQVFPRDIDLGKYEPIKGEWATPIKINPFELTIEDKADFIASFANVVPRHVPSRSYAANLKDVTVQRIEKIVATSEGSIYKQTYFTAGGVFSVMAEDTSRRGMRTSYVDPTIFFKQIGWELFTEARMKERVPEMIALAENDFDLMVEPVEVGRYEIVMSPSVAATLVSATFGDAAQIDRILGYEANSGGTSYLGPNVNSTLGSQIGFNEVNIKAQRSGATNLGNTKWDEEGVLTKDFDLVKNGKLVDLFTDRETTRYMKEWYDSQGRELRSNGCSRTDSASSLPMVHTPNLELMPGNGGKTFEEMVKNTERGIAFVAGGVGTDFQSRTGMGAGFMREIRNGVMRHVLNGAQMLFDSTEIWKAVTEVGKERQEIPVLTGKGQPYQGSNYTCAGVPIRIKDVAVVDGTRKS